MYFLILKLTPKHTPNTPMLLTFRSSPNSSKKKTLKGSPALAGYIYAGKTALDSQRQRQALQYTNAGLQPGAQAVGKYRQASLD